MFHGSDRQEDFRRPLQANDVRRDQRRRCRRRHRNRHDGRMVAIGRAGERTGQVLQHVMVSRIVGIAKMMPPVRARTARQLGYRRRTAMAAIARDQRQKATQHGEHVEPDKPPAKPALHCDKTNHHGFRD
jgi:hypothetical protein